MRWFWIAIGLSLGLVAAPPGALASQQEPGPLVPEPQPVSLNPAVTALLILDLSTRCDNPAQVCSHLVPGVRDLLSKARVANVFTVYTISASAMGTALGDPWAGFDWRPEEPVIYPDAFDKFHGGELQALLEDRGIRTVIVTGSSAHVAVLYTATSAARLHGYEVAVPLDGMNSTRRYEEEYTLHQLGVIPISPPAKVVFTTLEMIEFGGL